MSDDGEEPQLIFEGDKDDVIETLHQYHPQTVRVTEWTGNESNPDRVESLNGEEWLRQHATSHSPLPRLRDMNVHALMSGANPSDPAKHYKNELELEELQKEANWNAYQEALRLLDKAEAKAAHAQLLADALKGVQWKIQAYGSHWEPSQAEREAIGKALAQWNESPADADALEALDQLEQLEGGE